MKAADYGRAQRSACPLDRSATWERQDYAFRLLESAAPPPTRRPGRCLPLAPPRRPRPRRRRSRASGRAGRAAPRAPPPVAGLGSGTVGVREGGLLYRGVGEGGLRYRGVGEGGFGVCVCVCVCVCVELPPDCVVDPQQPRRLDQSAQPLQRPAGRLARPAGAPCEQQRPRAEILPDEAGGRRVRVARNEDLERIQPGSRRAAAERRRS